jgi:hypothetical protein
MGDVYRAGADPLAMLGERVMNAEAEVLRLTTVLQAIAAAGICATSHEIAKDALKRSGPTGSADR